MKKLFFILFVIMLAVLLSGCFGCLPLFYSRSSQETVITENTGLSFHNVPTPKGWSMTVGSYANGPQVEIMKAPDLDFVGFHYNRYAYVIQVTSPLGEGTVQDFIDYILDGRQVKCLNIITEGSFSCHDTKYTYCEFKAENSTYDADIPDSCYVKYYYSVKNNGIWFLAFYATPEEYDVYMHDFNNMLEYL